MKDRTDCVCVFCAENTALDRERQSVCNLEVINEQAASKCVCCSFCRAAKLLRVWKTNHRNPPTQKQWGEKVPVWQINNNSIHTVMRFAGRIRKWQRLINYRLNGRLIRGRQMDCCWQLPLTAYYWCSSHYPNQSDSPEWNEKEKEMKKRIQVSLVAAADESSN